MKQEDTRQKILAKALELFSVHGYDAVSVGQIAAAVGIKAPSLYNHFPSKRAIFDAIVEATAAQYEADTDRIDIHVQNARQDIPVFTRITEDGLLEKVRQIFFYSLHNETISRFGILSFQHFLCLVSVPQKRQNLCGDIFIIQIFSRLENHFKRFRPIAHLRARDGVSRGDLPQPHRGRGAPGRGRRGDGPLLCGPGHHPHRHL